MFFSKKDRNDKPLLEQKSEETETEITSQRIHSILGSSKDLIFTNINIGLEDSLQLTIFYFQGLVDIKLINSDILKPLIDNTNISKASNEKNVIKLLQAGQIHCINPLSRTTLNDCIDDIINGSIALIFDKEKTAITFNVQGFDKRGISESSVENVIKGSRESFIETLRVNTSIIRRKIKSPKLIIEETVIGKQTRTSIGIVYLNDIANKNIVNEIKKRLDSIDIDQVIASGFVEEYIIDNTYSPFPQVLYTERSDKFCYHIVSGKIGLVIDGLPVTYIIPATLDIFLHAQEDYSENFWFSSFIRALRYILMVLTLFTPAFYIAITTFHQEMLPTDLALSIAASKEGVPFPTFVEVLILLVAFEVLLESALRLPKNIGQAVSIVGALVVGESAVNASLLSPAVIIVIASTAIAGFTMPNQDFSNALRIWRFLLAVFSSIIGLFGIVIGALLLLLSLAKMESYGVPYLAPFVSQGGKQLQDSIIRMPLRNLRKRAIYLKTTNKKRQG